MLSHLKIALPSFLMAAVAGTAEWYLFLPLCVDQVFDEQVTVAKESVILAQGTFVDADRVHLGSG